ncbi:digalactosyldiacylglycerol synthase 1, chloroplastic-like [Musa acuminata AAA Group]|uniref:digalactosyldiacylglycerol synthase 1, chloroplastic-like n=1 Tax=Musa acuminata AAA Group TaxID=214697 RepID=UPI0031D3988C
MVRWKGVEEEEQGREWEPIRILKTGLKELERKSQSTSNELVEKLKSSLEVPPLDLPELLAYFVKQSGPFFNQLGIRQDICDKLWKLYAVGAKINTCIILFLQRTHPYPEMRTVMNLI